MFESSDQPCHPRRVVGYVKHGRYFRYVRCIRYVRYVLCGRARRQGQLEAHLLKPTEGARPQPLSKDKHTSTKNEC